MINIKFNKGLIAIGSGKGEGKSQFALKLANQIAKTENVLFISYQEYKENIIKIIREIDGRVNEKLYISTRFAYWGAEVFLDIIKYVRSNNISTVFLDDIETFCEISLEETFLEESKYDIIEDMKYLSELLEITFVFLTTTTKLKYEEIYHPDIKNFRWSRAINNECSQVFALYRPTYYGFTEDEYGNNLYIKTEIHYLKNKENENKILTFDNKEENMFSYKINK